MGHISECTVKGEKLIELNGDSVGILCDKSISFGSMLDYKYKK